MPSPSSSSEILELSLRVFLASPGDVTDERALAIGVLEQLQYEAFIKGKISIETVAWDKEGADTPLLASMTPQEAISLQRPKPSACDVVVVIFWSRMGTPLPATYRKEDGTPYLSGTEWEYLDALRAAREHGRPAVLVYRRKEVPTLPMDLDDAEREENLWQWQLVDTFFQSFTNADQSQGGGYNEYDTPDSFEKKLSAHLKEIFHQLLTAHEEQAGVLTTSKPASTSTTEANPPSAPVLWQGSPFPGLRAFGPDDAPIYFGRGRETDGLIRRLSEGQRFIAVVGASGSGKSSLVAAGLLPRLAANAIPGSRDWVALRLTPGGQSTDEKPGDNPFAALATAFKAVLDPHRRRVRDEANKLRKDPRRLAKLVALMLVDRPRWAQVLLFIDQFEELFTVVGAAYRQDFGRLLRAAVGNQRLRIVLTLRADFYHLCVEQEALAELLRDGSYPLAAPDRLALEEMITRPAARAGLVFEEGLPQRILDDTGEEPGALPLLAFSLAELYESGQSGGTLSFDAYNGFGGVQGAISRRAETTFSKLDPQAQAALHDVFRELIEIEETRSGWVATRRRAAHDELTADPSARRLVEAFCHARLLVSDEDAQRQPLIEVAHEALLSQWTRLCDWIAATGKDLQALRDVESAAAQWEQDKRPRDLLWPRRRRREAVQVIERLGKPMEGAPASFLAASKRRSASQTFVAGIGLSVVMLMLGFVAWLTYERIPVAEAWAVAKARLGIDYREPAMAPIEAGEFLMGSPADEAGRYDSEAQHEVEIEHAFELGKYEVTFEEYDLFARLTKRSLPSDQGWGRGRRPVINVSWFDASAYAQWLSGMTGKAYRLPTEAEWEYATRAGTRTPRFWPEGDGAEDDPACRYASVLDRGHEAEVKRFYNVYWEPFDCEDDHAFTAPVGSYTKNAWQLHDTLGNVWEWTQDCWHADYAGAPADGSARQSVDPTDCASRVLRGGSWNYRPTTVRSANRFHLVSEYRGAYVGFRLARSL